VISPAAKRLTTGEISAHLAEVYGAEVSGETVSRITDAVVEDLAAWLSRPLEALYPVVFIDAIHVKIRDGKVANRHVYTVVGVTLEGERDILGLAEWPLSPPGVAATAFLSDQPRRCRTACSRRSRDARHRSRPRG
jgi:transposase-like protein